MGSASPSDEDITDQLEDDIDMVDYDEEIKKLKLSILDEPCSVTLNEKLMECYKKNGGFDELESLRKEFSKKSPLSSSGWISWIKDSVASGAEREEVEGLFEMAVFDSNSRDVWLEYVQWSIGLGDFDYTRKIIESALLAVGLRVDIGFLMWHSYLDLEEALIRDESDVKQRERVISIFKRALRVPTVELAGIWERYEKFADGNVDEEIKAIHKASSEQLGQLSEYEVKLDKTDDSIDTFTEYLSFEMEKDDPGRIQSLYERIVDKHKQDDSAWLQYGMWCESRLKIHSVSCRVYQRAVRQCPFSCSLWQQTLLAMERAQTPAEQIDSVWNDAKNTIENADDGRALYRTYIYLLRRRAAATDGDYSAVAAVFEDGHKVLQEYFGCDWDPQAEFRRNYAYFAFSLKKDVAKARSLWSDILASGGGRLAERWLEAVRLERQFGDVAAARKLFLKALNSVSDHPNMIYEQIIQFEREEGSLDDLDRALQKVNAQVMHRINRPQKTHKDDHHQHQTPTVKGGRGRIEGTGRGGEKGGAKRVGGIGGAAPGMERKDRKRPSDEKGPVATVKKHAAEPKAPAAFASPAKDKDGFAMPTLPVKRADKSVSPSPSPSSSTTSFSANAASSAAAASNPKTGKDGNLTVFVSNLDFKVTAEKIKEVLDGVVEVRLLYRGASKLHKGYGFVDLDSEKNVRAALAKDRIPIDGRPMLVSVNDPEKRTGFKYDTGLEKTKVFVRNVHYDCTAEQLKEIFTECGEVRDVRIVTHKSGKSKGVAYVDFTTEAAAEKAIASEIVLLERTLSVALSNPPAKRDGSTPAELPPLPEGRKSSLQIVPRAVNRKPAAASAGPSATSGKPSAATGNGGAEVKKNLSNDEFRQFLNINK